MDINESEIIWFLNNLNLGIQQPVYFCLNTVLLNAFKDYLNAKALELLWYYLTQGIGGEAYKGIQYLSQEYEYEKRTYYSAVRHYDHYVTETPFDISG